MNARIDPREGAGRDRLRWAVRVRWLAIAGFSLLAIPAWSWGLLPSFRPCLVASLAATLVNAVNHWCTACGRGLRAVTGAAVSADVVMITYLIAATGGVGSPFMMLYVVQVVATALLVGVWSGAAAALASAGGFTTALWLGLGIESARPPLGDLQQVLWGLFLLYGLALLTFVGGFIASRLRQSEAELAVQTAGLNAATAVLRDTRRQLRQTEAQLLQSEKMRALGQFVAGIAHELNNPIGFVAANLEHVRSGISALERVIDTYAAAPLPAAARARLEEQARGERLAAWRAELPSALADCAEGARRAAEVVGALRAFARCERTESWTFVDLDERLDRALALLRHRLGPGVTLQRDYAKVPQVECLAGPLDQVFLNLLANAVDAVGERGTIGVHLRADESGQWVLISISDDGPGIPLAVQSRVFEPFFTTKPEGRGTGLGLSVSFTIVERHAGTLSFESAPGRGTTFTAALPLRRPPTVDGA
jgi:signal transduction histidine kinase